MEYLEVFSFFRTIDPTAYEWNNSYKYKKCWLLQLMPLQLASITVSNQADERNQKQIISYKSRVFTKKE